MLSRQQGFCLPPPNFSNIVVVSLDMRKPVTLNGACKALLQPEKRDLPLCIPRNQQQFFKNEQEVPLVYLWDNAKRSLPSLTLYLHRRRFSFSFEWLFSGLLILPLPIHGRTAESLSLKHDLLRKLHTTRARCSGGGRGSSQLRRNVGLRRGGLGSAAGLLAWGEHTVATGSGWWNSRTTTRPVLEFRCLEYDRLLKRVAVVKLHSGNKRDFFSERTLCVSRRVRVCSAE